MQVPDGFLSGVVCVRSGMPSPLWMCATNRCRQRLRSVGSGLTQPHMLLAAWPCWCWLCRQAAQAKLAAASRRCVPFMLTAADATPWYTLLLDML
jgi:hypothetical protein